MDVPPCSQPCVARPKSACSVPLRSTPPRRSSYYGGNSTSASHSHALGGSQSVLHKYYFFRDYCRYFGTCLLPGCDGASLSNGNFPCLELLIPADLLATSSDKDSDFGVYGQVALWPWGSIDARSAPTAFFDEAYGPRDTWTVIYPNVPKHCLQPTQWPDRWLPKPSAQHSDYATQYSSALIWSIAAITGAGPDAAPTSNAENVVTLVAIGVGYLLMAWTVATLTVAAMAVLREDSQQRSQMRELDQYMVSHKVPTCAEGLERCRSQTATHWREESCFRCLVAPRLLLYDRGQSCLVAVIYAHQQHAAPPMYNGPVRLLILTHAQDGFPSPISLASTCSVA